MSEHDRIGRLRRAKRARTIYGCSCGGDNSRGDPVMLSAEGIPRPQGRRSSGTRLTLLGQSCSPPAPSAAPCSSSACCSFPLPPPSALQGPPSNPALPQPVFHYGSPRSWHQPEAADGPDKPLCRACLREKRGAGMGAVRVGVPRSRVRRGAAGLEAGAPSGSSVAAMAQASTSQTGGEAGPSAPQMVSPRDGRLAGKAVMLPQPDGQSG